MYFALRSKITKAIKKNEILYWYLKNHYMKLSSILSKIIKDETFLKIQYKLRTGYKLNLNNPEYYNEKIQWLKLKYRNPLLKKLVDKHSVREYVKKKIGDQYLIPIYGVYNSIDEIDFNKLPDKFVVKLTNGSGYNYICTNKNNKELNKLRKLFNKWINLDFYSIGREWAYKDLRNRIIVEKYLEDNSETGLKDYKIFCFNGKAEFIQVDINRFIDHKRNLYTTNWDFIPVHYKTSFDTSLKVEKPVKLDKMIRLAETLAKDFPHVRVDFYYVNNKIYFGELTFYPEAGYGKFEPRSFEKKIGDLLDLSTLNIENNH